MATINAGERRGAALFVVLMFLIVITNLAFLALRFSASEIRSASLFVDGAKADELGQSIVPLTRSYISGDPRARLRGGSFTAAFDVGRVTVDYRSEVARVDVNRSPVALLQRVLAAAGLDQGEVVRIATRVTQRRSDRQNGLYVSPFEVSQDWGLSASQARKIVPLLTVANSGGKIDPLLAGPTILLALLDGSETKVANFREKRKIGFPDKGSALSYFAEPVQKWLTFKAVGPVRAVAQVVTRRGLRRRYEAVFDALGEGVQAKLYYWRPVD